MDFATGLHYVSPAQLLLMSALSKRRARHPEVRSRRAQGEVEIPVPHFVIEGRDRGPHRDSRSMNQVRLLPPLSNDTQATGVKRSFSQALTSIVLPNSAETETRLIFPAKTAAPAPSPTLSLLIRSGQGTVITVSDTVSPAAAFRSQRYYGPFLQSCHPWPSPMPN